MGDERRLPAAVVFAGGGGFGNEGGYFVGADGFEEVVGDAGAQGGAGVVEFVVGGDDDDARTGVGGEDEFGGAQAVAAWHADVEEDEVGAMLAGETDGVEAVVGLDAGSDGETFFGGDRFYEGADGDFVVGDEDFDVRHGCHRRSPGRRFRPPSPALSRCGWRTGTGL